MHPLIRIFATTLVDFCNQHDLNCEHQPGRANVWRISPANVQMYVLASTPRRGSNWWSITLNVIQRLHNTGQTWWLILLVDGIIHALTPDLVDQLFGVRQTDIDVHEPKVQQGLHFTTFPDLLGELLLPHPAILTPVRDQGWHTQDPELRVKIEQAAVKFVINHYQEMNREFSVSSVERENLGWDLEITQDGRTLFRVEVKGRGGCGDVELTPNEYAAMQSNKEGLYRLAVVRNALSDPMLTLFEQEDTGWRSADGKTLRLTPKTGAICRF
jgi:hypothetical protein